MTGLRQLLPLAVVMAVGACADRHEHIGVIYETDDFAVGLTEVREADGRVWSPDKSLAKGSDLHSGSPLVDAIFADGLHRLRDMMECDSGCPGLPADIAVMSGAALLDPDGVRAMLRSQAQVPGFGGWPLSGGALWWVPAAWHAFCATGDTLWLCDAYEISQRILSRSVAVGWDPALGLLRGQSPAWSDDAPVVYPRWADAVGRFESATLGGNVALAAAIDALERMRAVVAADTECPAVGSHYVVRRINSLLWDPGRGRYSAYLYGGPLMDMQAPVTDNISQALAVATEVATDGMALSVLSRSRHVEACVPDLFPLMAGMRAEAAFVNAPMLQMLWGTASAMMSREEGLRAAIATLCRMYAADPDGPSSSWLALLVIRGVLGMDAGSGYLEFHPAVPECFGSEITLRGLRYGKATIELNLRGSGSRIASFEIDGKATADYRLPSGMSGPHRVDISLANNSMDDGTVTEGQLQWCPPTPEVTWHTPVSGRIADYSGSFQYSLVIDGLADMRLATAGVALPAMNGVASVGVMAQGSDGQPGFCSAPRIYSPRGAVSRVEAEDYNRGGTRLVRDRRASQRYVESGAEGVKCISLTLTEPEEVDCMIDVCYANGNGPAGDPSSTALRRITVNGEDAGIIVMPPRGNGWWLSTGYSSRVRARLRRGVNDIAVSVVDNLGENASTDMVLVDNVRIVRLADND